MIFHIAERHRWEQAVAGGSYTASTLGRELHEEGFIHCSTTEQVGGVAERFYRGVQNLVLLHIDEAQLTSPVRWEAVGGTGGLFPHVYGPIDPTAVVRVEPFDA